MRVAGDVRYAQELVRHITPPCGVVDVNGNGSVGFQDLAILLNHWGPDGCPPAPESCAADLDDDGQVGFADLSSLLSLWGPCP